MIERQLLEMDNVWLDLLVEPCDILHVGQDVVSSTEDSNRELYVLQVVVWWGHLSVLLHVFNSTMVEAVELRPIRVNQLGVVLEVVDTGIAHLCHLEGFDDAAHHVYHLFRGFPSHRGVHHRGWRCQKYCNSDSRVEELW